MKFSINYISMESEAKIFPFLAIQKKVPNEFHQKLSQIDLKTFHSLFFE